MVHRFSELVPIEEVGDGRFEVLPAGRQPFLFGGLTLAATLRAAWAAAPEGKVPMSMRVSFLAGGTWGDPLAADVRPVFDSRGFAGRRVTLAQAETAVAAGDVWFHRVDEGADWQEASAAPAPPPPDDVAAVPTGGLALDLFEIRPWGPPAGPRERVHPYWARPHEPVDDPVVRACALAYVSDYMVIGTPFPAGSGASEGMISLTLEHTLWFHRPIPETGWWHYDAAPLTISGGRYVSRGTVHHEDGALLASFVQEGFIRSQR